MVNQRRESKISASILKKIRKDLGLKQKDLTCDGIKNISRLESGEMEISPTNALVLCEKIRYEMKVRGLHLDYDVTVDLILGKTNIITDELIQKLKYDNDTEGVLKEIHATSYKLNSDDAVNLLKNTIEILNEDIYPNAKHISEFCYTLLKFDLSEEKKIATYNNLIRSQYVLRQFESIVAIGKSLLREVLNLGDCEAKEKFLGNLALTYYELKNCEECEKTLSLLRSYSKPEKELYFSTIRATCKTIQNKKDEAEELYNSILKRSIQFRNIDYIANSYSNLADIYKDKDINKSKELIEKSLQLVNIVGDLKFAYHIRLNNLLINIEENNFKLCKCIFHDTMKSALALKNKCFVNRVIESMINLYIKNNCFIELEEFILNLKQEFKIILDSDLLVKILDEINDMEQIYKFVKIARK